MPQIKDDPIIEKDHKLREELYQQFKSSGLTYSDWLKATDDEFAQQLAEAGFKVIEQDKVQYLVEK